MKELNTRKGRGKQKEQVFFPVPLSKSKMPDNYFNDFQEIKARIQDSRLKTILSANVKMILLYWDLGKIILKKQETEGWGAKVIDRLSIDLKETFPDMTGFSPRNLKYMKSFASSWPEKTIVQRVVAQIPWRSILTIMDKIKDDQKRMWYIQKTLENGWSKQILIHQIEFKQYERHGKLTSNFKKTLPPYESDMAHQIFKDPYIFDFLGTADTMREKELEQGLVDHIQKFLLEMGTGFAFVGRQVHLELGNSDFYIDLLFYHLKLRCYVVIELKTGELEPGHISQINMYMNVVNDVLRHENDKQTIGLLLVKKKNRVIAEYCLQGYSKPIGIAEWEKAVIKSLPDNLKSSLPSIEEIESELSE